MLMDEDKPKKKRKKAVAADDGAGEHKRPWQENLATMAEIKAFLTDTTDEIESRGNPRAYRPRSTHERFFSIIRHPSNINISEL